MGPRPPPILLVGIWAVVVPPGKAEIPARPRFWAWAMGTGAGWRSLRYIGRSTTGRSFWWGFIRIRAFLKDVLNTFFSNFSLLPWTEKKRGYDKAPDWLLKDKALNYHSSNGALEIWLLYNYGYIGCLLIERTFLCQSKLIIRIILPI